MLKFLLVASALLVSSVFAAPTAQQQCTSFRFPNPKYLKHGKGFVTPNEATALEAIDRLYNLKDARVIKELYAPNIIQHVTSVGNGQAGLQAMFDTTVRNKTVKRESGFVFSNGNIVAVHGRRTGFDPKPMISLDYFRVECGIIQEQWDLVYEEIPVEQLPAGNLPMFTPGEQDTMGDCGNEAANIAFTNSTMSQLVYNKDLSIIDRYISTDFQQHNTVPSGRAGFSFIFSIMTRGEIGFIVARGNIMAVHARWFLGNDSYIGTEMLRLVNNTFVEHWDVLQMEPPASASVNGNSMFDRSEVNLIRGF